VLALVELVSAQFGHQSGGFRDEALADGYEIGELHLPVPPAHDRRGVIEPLGLAVVIARSSQDVPELLVDVIVRCSVDTPPCLPQSVSPAFVCDTATLEVWGALLNGARLVVMDEDTALSPPLLAAALRDHDIHTVVMDTPLFHQIVGHDPATFSPLRHLLVCGDTMSPRAARETAALGGPLLARGYGPTESTTFATVQPLPRVPENVSRLPIGGPISNTRVYVLDPWLNPVPIGVPGQLYIGGEGLARGYLDRPGLTAEKFLPDPFNGAPGARMYGTGDLARWLPEGSIDLLGRIDPQGVPRGIG
jgi:non-ribosomal peptide synthetase component F